MTTEKFEKLLESKKRKSVWDKCKCGNIKSKFAKECRNCFSSNKLKGKTTLWNNSI
jgi:hypothetical protein